VARVTILLTSYNQAPFLREAVRSVLAQEHDPLEIVLSDDASRDDSFAVIAAEAAAYRGPHRLIVNRNPETLGSAHIPSLLPRTTGEILVHAHGDDVALPDRTRILVGALERSGAALASSNAEMIDGDGTALGMLVPHRRSARVRAQDIIQRSWQRTMLGASFAMRREVYARFRPIDRTMPPVADHVLPFRAALIGGAIYLGVPLLRYRRHGENMSAMLATGGGDPRPTEEILGARVLEAFAWMWGDLDALRAAGTSAELDEIERHLLRRIAWQTQLCLRAREALERDGWQPRWIDRAAAESRPVPQAIQIRPLSPEPPA